MGWQIFCVTTLALAFTSSQVLAASTNPSFAYSADRESGGFCVASLIHRDVLLTAASCRGVFLKGAFVGGSKMDGSDGQYHEVEFEAVHPSFDSTADNNIMLVKLKEPSDAVVQEINPEDHEPVDGAELQVLGFNRASQTSVFPTQESDVVATKMDHSTCASRYSGHGIYVPEHLIFCSTTTSTTCHGNLGSPLIDNRGNQVGLVAGGAECNSALFPVLNVRTSAFSRFMFNGVCTISSEPFESCSGHMTQSFRAAPTGAPTPGYMNSKDIEYQSAGTAIEYEDVDAPTAEPVYEELEIESLENPVEALNEEPVTDLTSEGLGASVDDGMDEAEPVALTTNIDAETNHEDTEVEVSIVVDESHLDDVDFEADETNLGDDDFEAVSEFVEASSDSQDGEYVVVVQDESSPTKLGVDEGIVLGDDDGDVQVIDNTDVIIETTDDQQYLTIDVTGEDLSWDGDDEFTYDESIDDDTEGYDFEAGSVGIDDDQSWSHDDYWNEDDQIEVIEATPSLRGSSP